jgi:hypothetical protein
VVQVFRQLCVNYCSCSSNASRVGSHASLAVAQCHGKEASPKRNLNGMPLHQQQIQILFATIQTQNRSRGFPAALAASPLASPKTIPRAMPRGAGASLYAELQELQVDLNMCSKPSATSHLPAVETLEKCSPMRNPSHLQIPRKTKGLGRHRSFPGEEPLPEAIGLSW